MTEPGPVHITTRTGKVRVAAVEGFAAGALSVDGGVIQSHGDGSIQVRRAPSAGSIEVRCAPGTDVTVGTVSGSVDLAGALGAVRIVTVSGRVRVEEAVRIDVRSKSGKIDIGTCADDLRIMTKSSAVHVRRAARATVASVSGIVLLESVGGADVKAVSGKVLIGSSGGERVSVHSVSGKVEIHVPATSRPSVRLRTMSGRIDNDLIPGDEYEISVRSVSGPIRVSTA